MHSYRVFWPIVAIAAIGLALLIFTHHTRAQQPQQRLVENVALPSLDIVDNVVFAQALIAEDVDVFDQPLLWLLRAGMVGEDKQRESDGGDCHDWPEDTIRVHKCRFP